MNDSEIISNKNESNKQSNTIGGFFSNDSSFGSDFTNADGDISGDVSISVLSLHNEISKNKFDTTIEQKLVHDIRKNEKNLVKKALKNKNLKN